ncbi:hypothetical protein AcV5_007791 [Taiwanofungus camphoratus]|nr:hypothetical protein AcV5_007791 [Antrodia cinnamomea]
MDSRVERLVKRNQVFAIEQLCQANYPRKPPLSRRSRDVKVTRPKSVGNRRTRLRRQRVNIQRIYLFKPKT